MIYHLHVEHLKQCCFRVIERFMLYRELAPRNYRRLTCSCGRGAVYHAKDRAWKAVA
jgi:hypothetical protein